MERIVLNTQRLWAILAIAKFMIPRNHLTTAPTADIWVVAMVPSWWRRGQEDDMLVMPRQVAVLLSLPVALATGEGGQEH